MGGNDQTNSTPGQGQSSSTIVQPMDLNVSSMTAGNNGTQRAGDESLSQSSTPNTSQQSSPTKSTPNKSKNKKKNDAKRRNAKKQQQLKQHQKETQVAITNSQLNSSTNNQSNNPVQSISQPMETSSKITKETISPDALNNSQQQPVTLKDTGTGNIKSNHDTNIWQRKHLELKEQLKQRDDKIQLLTDKYRQQINKTKELEALLVTTTKACNQFEKLLQQEVACHAKLDSENESLKQTIARLRNQINVHERAKATSEELIRVLNATLMERETEVSILKLKMTRLQTNPNVNASNLNSASSVSSMKQDPTKSYASTGRSNSEFCRNSYIRSSMMAEAASARSSTSQLQVVDKDASVWATIPAELTPSKRPLLLERSFQPIYSDSHYNSYGSNCSSMNNQSSTPIMRDRRYKTLPRSMKSPSQEFPQANDKPVKSNQCQDENPSPQPPKHCLVTNLDDSNSTNNSSGANKAPDQSDNVETNPETVVKQELKEDEHVITKSTGALGDNVHKEPDIVSADNLENNHSWSSGDKSKSSGIVNNTFTPDPYQRTPSTPVKISSGIKKIFGKFRKSDSTTDSRSKPDLTVPESPLNIPSSHKNSAFQRCSARATLVGPPTNIRAQLTPTRRPIDFETDKPFAEWDTDMLADWLSRIGLSMYSTQCKLWVKCGAHIMNATPAEVDKGLGITNHLHRKKLRLAISELNGDCDKITKAAAKLDYLWVARWLDDIGLPQHKDAFINARVDGRVLNYLTVEDLVSMNVKSVLHHASIRCGIRVLRSIGFDLQLLKRRATAEECEEMNLMRQRMETDGLNSTKSLDQRANASFESEIPMWTCHRVMEWLRMIEFSEFAPNLRGSGVHGGLIMFEDGFNVDTMCTLLSIPTSRTLLRRHLSSYFELLIGPEQTQRKKQYKEQPSSQQMNPAAEIKTSKKSPWFSKLRSLKVGQDAMDEYLCPMYPVEPQLVKSPTRKGDFSALRDNSNLPKIPESINV